MAAHWGDKSELAKALRALKRREELEWHAGTARVVCLLGTLLLACIAAGLWLWFGQR